MPSAFCVRTLYHQRIGALLDSNCLRSADISSDIGCTAFTRGTDACQLRDIVHLLLEDLGIFGLDPYDFRADWVDPSRYGIGFVSNTRAAHEIVCLLA